MSFFLTAAMIQRFSASVKKERIQEGRKAGRKKERSEGVNE